MVDASEQLSLALVEVLLLRLELLAQLFEQLVLVLFGGTIFRFVVVVLPTEFDRFIETGELSAAIVEFVDEIGESKDEGAKSEIESERNELVFILGVTVVNAVVTRR